jgi:hypothetical protein
MQTIAQIQQILAQRLHGAMLGPVVESQEYDERNGKLYRVFTWEVANGTYIEKDLPHGWLAEVVPNNFNKSKLRLKISRKRTDTDAYVDGFFTDQNKKVGTPDLIPPMFRRGVKTVVTTDRLSLEKDVLSNIPDPAALSGNTVEIEHDKVDDQNYDRIVTDQIIESVVGPFLGEQTGTWGVEGTSKRMLDDENPTPTPYGYGTKEAETVPLGNGKTIENVVTYPDSPATLYGLEIDENTKIEVEIQKSLEDATTAIATAHTRITEGWCAEVQPLDKWHSILICSRIPDSFDGLEQTWTETQNINLPSELTELGVIWDDDGDSNESYAELDNISIIELDRLPWQVSAEAAAVASIVGRPYAKIKDGFTGAAEVTVVRTFSKEAPIDIIEAHMFRPVRATLTLKDMTINHQANSQKHGTGEVNTGASKNFRGRRDTNVSIIQMGPFEHNNIILTQIGTKTRTEIANAWSGSIPGGGIYPSVQALAIASGEIVCELPASSIPLTSGQTFIRNVSTSPWRLGYWVREVYTAKIPSA